MRAAIVLMGALVMSGAAEAGEVPNAADVKHALAAASPAKVATAEFFANWGRWPQNNAEAGYISPVDQQASINIGPGGVVTVVFPSPTIMLTPKEKDGVISWTCEGVGFNRGVLPKGCR